MSSDIIVSKSSEFAIPPPIKKISALCSSRIPIVTPKADRSNNGFSGFSPTPPLPTPPLPTTYQKEKTTYYENGRIANPSSFPVQKKPRVAGMLWLNSSNKNKLTCNLCRDSGVIVFDSHSGDQICSECGFVVEAKVMSDEQEWRSFNNDSGGGGNDRNRVGGPNDQWLEGFGQGTSMLGASKKLQQAHDSATSSGGDDKLLKNAFASLRFIAEAFCLRDNVTERAKEIIKDMQECNSLKTRGSIINMLAVIYLACRDAGVTRTIKELVVYDRNITEKELGKAINRLKKILPDSSPSIYEAASELMPRFCSRLQLSMHVTAVAEYVAKRSTEVINKSHRPNSVAAGAIYIVTQLCNVRHVTCAQIATIAGTGENTIKYVYKEMLLLAEHLLPPEFKPSLEGGVQALRKAALGGDKKRKKPNDFFK